MTTAISISGLPGESLIRQGLADLAAARATVPALLLRIGRGRLVQAGLIRSDMDECADAELRLYDLLRSEGGDAYSRYNALVRELVSFEQALEHRQRLAAADDSRVATTCRS